MSSADLKKPLRVYVAGAYIHREIIRTYIDELATDPKHYEITFDWTRAETQSASLDAKTEEYCRSFADQEIKAVKSANTVVAILNDSEYPYQGTFTELGVALGNGCQVIIVCPFDFDAKKIACHRNIFYSTSLATRVKTWEDALILLRKK